jgi:hypothetical protein
MEDADDEDEDVKLVDPSWLVQDAILDFEGEEDLSVQSPTLTRFDEGDVEFGMDDVPEWFLDEGGDCSESDEEEDEM